MTKKLGQKRGYSLLEALLAVLIISLIAVAVSSGLSAATKVYREAVFSSNSQILQDTINAAASDILRFAKDVNTVNGPDGGTVCFCNSEYGAVTDEGYIGEKNGYLYLFANSSDSGGLLVNTGAYDDMKVSDFRMSYEESAKIFTATYDLTNKDGLLVKSCGFTYRTIAE